MRCSGVPGEELTAALWATMPGPAERPTGWPAAGGESRETPSRTDVVTALLGVLVGALVAATAQLWVRRSQTRERWLGELLQRCAEIYALESASRGHAFDASQDPARPVAPWDVERRRQAEAAVFLLTTDAALVESVEALGRAGRAMHQGIGTDGFGERAATHAAALEGFSRAAREALRHRRVL